MTKIQVNNYKNQVVKKLFTSFVLSSNMFQFTDNDKIKTLIISYFSKEKKNE
jgi:hypothetical protein